MQAFHLADETGLDTDSTKTKPTLRVVIAYNDIAAGKRAMDVLAGLGKHFGDDILFQPLPWSFDVLAEVHWRKVAASEAVNADILIIAASNADPLPEAVSRWAETAIKQKRGTAAAVVALFGPDGNPDGAGSSRLESIQTVAQLSGLDFFAPSPNHELNEAIALVHQRAAMVTPVLEEILHRPPPALRSNPNL